MVKPNYGGIDEVLIGILNAAELYGEHYNLIREQEINREIVKPNGEENGSGAENYEAPKDGRLPVRETISGDDTAANQSEETDQGDTAEHPEGQSTESQPEPTADQSLQDETKEAESPATRTMVGELQEKPESVELTHEEKEAARRKALSDAAKARHAAKKAAEALRQRSC